MSDLKQLSRYTIQSHLGTGAFADVYKALDTVLNRTVALKILKPMLVADNEAFVRFTREAQTLANLMHPQIAWVWDMGEAEGYYFIAMRYVDGKALDKVIAERSSLPWDETLKITGQIAGALQFAHDKGLVHRDVKPQNIIISGTDGAVLTDFGLVRAIASSGMTTTTSMLGTPSYIAPEIWEGQEASPASDQYALACVVTEMLTGKVLFGGTTLAIMKKVLFDPLSLPEKWPEGVPQGINVALEQALAKDPAKRFGNLGEFTAALQAPSAKTTVSLKPLPTILTEASLAKAAVSPLAPAPTETQPVKVPINALPDISSGLPLKKKNYAIHEDEMTVNLAPGVDLVFVRIPTGTFLMGSTEKDRKADPDEKPQHKVRLDEYWMGKTPVTNEQYLEFVKASNYDAPGNLKKGKIPKGKGDHPVVNINWLDARAFCQWASRVTDLAIRLPTEAEWEKAARGTDGRKFPWGDEKPDASRCNFDKYAGGTTPVGHYSPTGDSSYGCADMAGNVSEWTSSLKADYPYRADDGREEMKAIEGAERVLRGGEFDFNDKGIRCAFRDWDPQSTRDRRYGFRASVSLVDEMEPHS
jgi:serine/threonine-protein kinase